MKSRSGQVAFVVDQESSPLWRAAYSHSLRSGNYVFAADQYASEYALIREILKVSPTHLIFTWRGAFDSVLQSRRARNLLLKRNVSIYLLIPDLIGIHNFSEREQIRIHNADGLIVTSEELLDKYKELYELKSIQLLHDVPPLEAFEKISSAHTIRNPHKLIWVGNSKWGERTGFVDHKGLHGFALPVFQELQTKRGSLSLAVIDSAFKKLPYEVVLNEIASSACLIFTSESEGTGLPLIEAALLGTPLVTFSVGISPELLKGELAVLISPRDLEIFAAKISFVLDNNDAFSEKISLAADEYVKKILGDFNRLVLDDNQAGSWREQRNARSLLDFLKWKIRWIRYLRSKVVAK